MRAFFVKTQVDISKKIQNFISVLTVYAYNEDEAREIAEHEIKETYHTDEFEIKRISTIPIYIFKYLVKSKLKYRDGGCPIFYFTLNAENKDEAEKMFRQIVGRWTDIVGIEILNIEKNQKNGNK